MSAIFLILTGILFIIMLVIDYRSEDDFCRPIKYKREIEKNSEENEKVIQDYLNKKPINSKFKTRIEMDEDVINDWIEKNQDKIKNWKDK